MTEPDEHVSCADLALEPFVVTERDAEVLRKLGCQRRNAMTRDELLEAALKAVVQYCQANESHASFIAQNEIDRVYAEWLKLEAEEKSDVAEEALEPKDGNGDGVPSDA